MVHHDPLKSLIYEPRGHNVKCINFNVLLYDYMLSPSYVCANLCMCVRKRDFCVLISVINSK